MSDLIVIGHPDEETAEKVWNELVKLREDFLVDPEDAAIIRCDQKGRLHVTTPAHHAVTWGTLSGLFQDMLEPGTSAIMVIVRKVTPDKFIEALKPYGGTVLKTSLPHTTRSSSS